MGARLLPALHGALSAALFILIYGYGFGMPLLMLAPAVPLLVSGLRGGLHPFGLALAGAGLITVVASGPGGLLFFFGIIGIPALLFIAGAHRRPTGWLLTEIALFAAAACAALMLHLAPEGGLEPVFKAGLAQGLAEADPALVAAMEHAVSAWGFLLLGGSVYFWVLLFYAHVLLARFLAKTAPLPPLAPFPLTPWLAVPLAMTALASLMDGQLAFAGKTLFLLLLCPYFLLGLAYAHARLRAYPLRPALLLTLYFILFTQGWPALIFACIGLWQQVKDVSLNWKA